MRLLRSFAIAAASFAGITAVTALTPLDDPATGTVQAAGPCGIQGVEVDQDAEEQAFLTLINNYRAENGRAPLTVSYTLSRASAWKSRHLGENSYFAHDDTPIGRSWSTRVRDCGYNYSTGIGENIAAGYGTAASVFDGWRNSPGHNSNMLGSGYTAIGIGRVVVPGSPYGTYWTTVFGGYSDGWAEASAGEVITPIAEEASTAPTVGQAATVSAVAPPPGGGRQTPALRFAGLCARLLERDHPAYDRLCIKR